MKPTFIAISIFLCLPAFGQVHSGFKKTNGIEYKIIKDMPGKKIKMGDVIEVHILQKMGPVVMRDTRKETDGTPIRMEVQESNNTGSWQAALLFLTAGDSAVVKISCDTLMKYISPDDDPSHWLQKGKVIVMNISIVSVKTLEESERYGQKAEKGRPEQEINYLTRNYTGKVAVIFNQPNDAKKEYTGSRRVYKIPACGILKTEFTRPKAVIYDNETIDNDVLFVYADDKGTITDTLHFLPHFRNEKTYNDFYARSSGKVFVMGWGYGGFSFGNKKYDAVESYIIDTLKNYKKYESAFPDKSDMDKCK